MNRTDKLINLLTILFCLALFSYIIYFVKDIKSQFKNDISTFEHKRDSVILELKKSNLIIDSLYAIQKEMIKRDSINVLEIARLKKRKYESNKDIRSMPPNELDSFFATIPTR